MTDYVIAAMLGCWRWESGVNPGIWESQVVKDWHYVYGTDGEHMGGFGLGQWTNTGGDPNGRLWRLHEWVTSNGYADGDGAGQIAYIPIENNWHQHSVMGYTSLQEFMESDSTDLNLLVEEFLACWEGVPGDHLAQRQQYAADFYTYIQQHKNDPPGSFTWTSRNGYLTESEMFGNAMAAYFQLGGMGSFHLYGAVRDVLRRLIIHA